MKLNKRARFFLLAIISITLSLTNLACAASSQPKQTIFKISTGVYINHRFVSKPVIVLRENQKGSVTTKKGTEKLTLGLVAKNTPHHDIDLRYNILFKTNKETLRTNPRLVLMPYQKATIRFEEHGSQFELRVMAERK